MVESKAKRLHYHVGNLQQLQIALTCQLLM